MNFNIFCQVYIPNKITFIADMSETVKTLTKLENPNEQLNIFENWKMSEKPKRNKHFYVFSNRYLGSQMISIQISGFA